MKNSQSASFCFPDARTATICPLGHVHCPCGPMTLHFRSLNDFTAFMDRLAEAHSGNVEAVKFENIRSEAVDMAVGYLPLHLTPSQAGLFARTLTEAHSQGDEALLWNWLQQQELTH